MDLEEVGLVVILVHTTNSVLLLPSQLPASRNVAVVQVLGACLQHPLKFHDKCIFVMY